MDPLNNDVKDAVLEAEKFLSVTLAKENLSPAVEKERSLLAEKLRKVKTQLGLQSDSPGGGKAPPRPPKGGVPLPVPVTTEQPAATAEPEELYDDVAGVIPSEPNAAAKSSNASETYEIMTGEADTAATPASQGDGGEDYMAMDEDIPQEDYEEPQPNEPDKQQASAIQEEEYEMPGADADYEVTDTSKPPADNVPDESDEMYECAEPGTGSVDGVPTLEYLTKITKPDDIKGVIKTGFLNKRRKEGKVYIGSKFQKRYCVVRNHIMYYFKDKKSPKQQGSILLPNYKVALANKKGREFILTLDGQRPFQFEANSKKEADEWMSAIQSAADAPLVGNHNLDELRNRQHSDDESSLHYEKSGMEEPEVRAQDDEEMYDDTKEDLYEEVGSIQPATPSQQSSQPIQYEISTAVATSPKPAEPSPATPLVDEDYEIAEQPTAPAPPPPRPSKPQAPAPKDDTPLAVPPPRPTKQQLPTPQEEEMYEEADTPATDLPPPPAPEADVELENYEDLDTIQEQVLPPPPPVSAPAPVPTRPPKRKVSPPSKNAGQSAKPHSANRKDGTSRRSDVLAEDVSCYCGRKIKSRDASSCTTEGKRARCPCLRNGRSCTAKCKCRFCGNRPRKERSATGCRCGEEKYKRTNDPDFVSCIDSEGKRKTKCPCYSSGTGCYDRCRCLNCKNSFGATDRPFRIPQPKPPGKPAPKLVGCRCGEGRKDPNPGFLACVDVQGKRSIKATRCPCFRAGIVCQEYCKCLNCQNYGDDDGSSSPKRLCTVTVVLDSAEEYPLF